MKIKGSFGVLLLAVVMVVVLVLVARAWERLAAPAIAVTQHGSTEGVNAHGQTEAAESVQHQRSNLKKTTAKTDAHTEAVTEALAAID